MYLRYDFSQKIQITRLYAWLIQQSNKIAILLTNSIIRMKERGIRMKERGIQMKEWAIQMKERGIQMKERGIQNQKKPSIYRNEPSVWWQMYLYN